MTTSAPPPGEPSRPSEETPPAPGSRSARGPRPSTGWTDLRFRWVNLLVLVPLVTILPFLFNQLNPTLGGLPFFYWFQLLIIPVGVLCTLAVHRLTRQSDEEGER
jgi:hypothetical protein